MHPEDTNAKVEEAQTIALLALGWVLADERRADRLLGMTGLDPQAMRARIHDPALLGAVLGFLEAHEPDLVACAGAIGRPPEALVRARGALER